MKVATGMKGKLTSRRGKRGRPAGTLSTAPPATRASRAMPRRTAPSDDDNILGDVGTEVPRLSGTVEGAGGARTNTPSTILGETMDCGVDSVGGATGSTGSEPAVTPQETDLLADSLCGELRSTGGAGNTPQVGRAGEPSSVLRVTERVNERGGSFPLSVRFADSVIGGDAPAAPC